MEKFFKNKGITIQPFIHKDGSTEYYAYTDKLLKNNILIEFYTGPLNDSKEYYEEETAVSILTYNEENSYDFFLFVSHETISPLLLYRIVVDAIDYIHALDDKDLLENIKEISTGCSIHSKNEIIHVYNNFVSKIKHVMKLINKRN
ncbi:hypothetical protein CEQ15_11340 [Chryseobacterium indologenes]|uniref:hypothetical protein n=1 Tax=Chryseobacterium indologenes TaxID=253 RepID=UPI000B517199|nr:hypothetical protein [Chryseobacterium indologenes]ASE62042.1 hypothetical protein CEQ15_11340 [Chryseobacterium indologenes]